MMNTKPHLPTLVPTLVVVLVLFLLYHFLLRKH